MSEKIEIRAIARFRSPFATKFGIPRQSGVVAELRGQVVLEPAFRSADALRGIEGFDYLWLLWQFSANAAPPTATTVRPPRLGGNERVGVWATRSPFRPNGLGLSAVRLERVEWDTPSGPVLHVLGGDLMDGTPIVDIKPYIPYCDAYPDARAGFTDERHWQPLEVEIDEAVAAQFDSDTMAALRGVLAQDPRPHYHHDPERVYGFSFAGQELHFTVDENNVLHLT